MRRSSAPTPAPARARPPAQPPYVDEFPPLAFAVDENLAAGTPVCLRDLASRCAFSATAQTQPHHETLRFSIASPNPNHAGRFVVHNLTGAFALGAALDYEEAGAQRYELLVTADDQGSRDPGVDLPLQHVALLTVEVRDVNDRPVALQPRLALAIDENPDAPRAEAGCARVHDDDVHRTGALAPTQSLRYALVATSAVWTLDPASGCVRAAPGAPVDAEDSRFGATYNRSARVTRHAVHELRFTATDDDPDAPLTSEAAALSVRVLDVGDAAIDSAVGGRGARGARLPTTGIDDATGAPATVVLRGRDLGPTDGSGEFVVRYSTNFSSSEIFDASRCVAVRDSCAPARAASNCAIECEVREGVGEGHRLRVRIVGSAHDVDIAASATVSYAPPTIRSVAGVGVKDALTAGGQALTLVGEGFGPPGLKLKPPVVRYGPLASGSPTGRWFFARDCAVRNDAELACLTSEGAGGPYAIVVEDVGGQRSPYFSETPLAYGQPIITRFEGPGRRDATTHGGDRITIVGVNFGPDESLLDAVECADEARGSWFAARECYVHAPHTRIVCLTPAGPVGARLTWRLRIAGKHSTTPSTSSAQPSIASVRLDGDAPIATTAGGDVLRVVGAEFGVRDDRITSVSIGPTGTECVRRGASRRGARASARPFYVPAHAPDAPQVRRGRLHDRDARARARVPDALRGGSRTPCDGRRGRPA